MKTILVSIFLTLVMFSWYADAKPPKNKGGKGGKPDNEQQEKREDREDLRDLQDGLNLVSSVISVGDARNIALGAGATGYKPLPKGIRKNLARGKPMPPGIQKSRMNANVLGKLPKRDGYEWRNAGTDLLLVQAGTEIVADVLTDVFK